MLANRSFVGGFSLLETLLVVALIATLSSLAIPYWQAQQYPAKRQLAWLQLQQLLLTQVEYQMHTGSFSTEVGALPSMTQQLGYDFYIQLDDGLWLQAVVQDPGPQMGDQQCWQLWLHEDGRRLSYDQGGKQTFTCE